MKTKLIILPLLLGSLLVTSCNNSSNDKFQNPYKYSPEWINHPYEALRYPEMSINKVKMSNHKKYSFDEKLTVRNAIFSIPYESYEKKEDFVKSKNYVTYTVYYGMELDSVLAKMEFYDNGSIYMKDLDNHEYYYSLNESNIKVIFDAAEKDIKEVEAIKVSSKEQAKNDCTAENFIANCMAYNNSHKDKGGLKYSFCKDPTRFISLSYAALDNGNDVINKIRQLSFTSRSNKDSKKVDGLGDAFFTYEYIANEYYAYIYKQSDSKYHINFVKRYGNTSDGKISFYQSSYELKETECNSFLNYVGRKLDAMYK